jgi:hypothetical protein
MIFVIRMGAGPALNTTSPGSLKLRSSATAYLLIECKRYLFALLISISCLSQNKQILYNFTSVPQS